MMVLIDKNRDMRDLSLLAIEAAEELERYRRRLPTGFKSVNALATMLQESFVNEVKGSNSNPRLDHATVFSSAISNSIGTNVPKKSISEIAKEANKVAAQLNSNIENSKDDELKKLVSFCIALSDSAALYREELEELRRHIA